MGYARPIRTGAEAAQHAGTEEQPPVQKPPVQKPLLEQTTTGAGPGDPAWLKDGAQKVA